MKASEHDWRQATINLKARRKAVKLQRPNPASDYAMHLIKCGVGESVLDVGCGSQYLKTCLPRGVEYVGLDAFPVEGTDTIPMPIEDCLDVQVDTVCAFAVLDNCLDFDIACKNIKRIAQKNIIILTGIGIEVDEFHTFKLEHSDFDRVFSDLKCTYKEEICPKVWLLNYQK
jgi:hypothetical protein